MKRNSIIYNFILMINRHSQDTESRNLVTVNLYIICSVLLAAFSFALRWDNPLVFLVFILFAVFWIINLYIILKFMHYRFMSIETSLICNLLMIPSIYLMTGGLANGTVLLFVVGLIGNFFLIGDKKVYFVSVVELLFYIIIILFSKNQIFKIFGYYKLPENTLSLGPCLSFLFAAVVPLFIIIFQTVSYDKDHKNLINSYKMIQEARNNKSSFLSNMAQEIRMPMNAIIGMNEIILREESDPVTKELSMQIRTSAKQLLKIINNIVEYSKMDLNRLSLYPELYSFKKMINGVIESFANEYLSEKNHFFAYIDPHIPAMLYGDVTRIKQMFMYLLFSAIGKNNNNRISLSIQSERNKSENVVKMICNISISGDGLSQGEIDAMMSAYSKYDSRLKSDYKGMGLELSICREILRMMNGQLDIDSIEGIGTSVSFSFENYIIDDQPMIRLEVESEPSVLVYVDSSESQNSWIERFKEFDISLYFVNGPNAFKKVISDRTFSQIFIPSELYDILKKPIQDMDIEKNVYIISDRSYVYGDYDKCRLIYNPLTSINVSEALNGIWDETKFVAVLKNEEVIFPNAKVLIVDDSIVNLKVLKGILNAYAINPDLAKNADEALMHIDKNLYNLIILDQIMPGVDGIELLHIISELPNANNKTPILCATADFGQEVGRRLEAEGFCDYLAKPVQQYYLERMLRKYLPRELAQKPVKEEEPKTMTASAAQQADNTPEHNPIEVDFNHGIETTGGSKEAYGAILNSYYKEGCKKIKDITEELIDNNIDLYVIDVHALKSSSAAIGAQGISEMFKALEFAGREGRRDFIDNNTDKTLNFFEEVLKKIEEYLISENMMEQDVSDTQKDGEIEEIDVNIVLEMQDSLNKINLRRCEEIINELNDKNFGAEINGIVQSIKNSYDMFDYPTAKTFIQELVDKINI